MIDLKMK